MGINKMTISFQFAKIVILIYSIFKFIQLSKYINGDMIFSREAYVVTNDLLIINKREYKFNNTYNLEKYYAYSVCYNSTNILFIGYDGCNCNMRSGITALLILSVFMPYVIAISFIDFIILHLLKNNLKEQTYNSIRVRYNSIIQYLSLLE